MNLLIWIFKFSVLVTNGVEISKTNLTTLCALEEGPYKWEWLINSEVQKTREIEGEEI